jgi:hypothetical protein
MYKHNISINLHMLIYLILIASFNISSVSESTATLTVEYDENLPSLTDTLIE